MADWSGPESSWRRIDKKLGGLPEEPRGVATCQNYPERAATVPVARVAKVWNREWQKCGTKVWKSVEQRVAKVWNKSVEQRVEKVWNRVWQKCGTNSGKSVEQIVARVWSKSMEKCGTYIRCALRLSAITPPYQSLAKIES